MILDNRQITIREVANDVGISFSSWQAIFTDVLGMKRGAAKIVTKLLNFLQKQRRIVVAQEMLMTFNDDPDLFGTGDESWDYCFEISSQWKRPEDPRSKKAHQVR